VESRDRLRVALDVRLSPAQRQEARDAERAHEQLEIVDATGVQPIDVMVLSRVDPAGLAALARLGPLPAAGRVLVSAEVPPTGHALQALARDATDLRCGRPIGEMLAGVAERASRDARIEQLLDSPLVQDNLCGHSAAWRAALREVVLATRGSRAPVMLLGETGTGKELLARLVHTLDESPGRGALVVVDCTTLSHELAASELFGHERGAYTGAVGSRRGAVAAADGGTLFLDEVGELPLAVQAQLLRVLQEGKYKSVGGTHWQAADFRLVCATHRDLEAAVAEGRFRADLYFRMAVNVVRVPALRERRGDILPLARRFLAECGCGEGPDALVQALLEAAPFPGNVRELRQLMRRASAAHGAEQGPVSAGCLPRAWLEQVALGESVGADMGADKDAASTVATAEDVVRQWLEEGLGLAAIEERAGEIAIRLARAMEGGQVGRAARRLGVTDRALQKRQRRQSYAAPG
jgi:transcriptional regulator with GAF, ATPase, and Fis domain